MGNARLDFRIVAVLAVTVGALPFALAAPKRSSADVCAPTCRPSHDSKLSYVEGTTYIYSFQSESTTAIVGATNDSKTLTVKGEAVIAAQSPCDFVLTLRNVQAQAPSGEQTIVEDGSAPARFTLQDGVIEGLCLGPNATTWYANLKRGIISMMQNAALKNQGESLLHETDISGTCPTQYKVTDDTYVKTRNLNSCRNREGGNTVSFGVPYDVSSKRNSLPGLVSTMSCTQTILNGVYSNVECSESHKLQAFSKADAGAQTTIKSTLILQRTSQGLQIFPPENAQPASIFFDHSDFAGRMPAPVAALKLQSTLNEMCVEIANGVVSAKVPALFLQLKKFVEFVSLEDLKKIREEVTSEKLCAEGAVKLEKLLLDAAAMSAGDAGIALLAELYPSEELSDETKNLFHIYTAFAARPGPLALDAMEKLLENDSSFGNSGLLLAASGLGHQYCKVSETRCGEQDAYVGLVNQIARQALTHCASENKEEDGEHAVVALQALGNLMHLPSEAINAINKCMEGSERLQIRALDAFRRDPCNRDLKEMAIETFGKREMTSDVRIMGYLSASKCLEDNDLERIQKTLDQENSNQVLSFVASHILNQQATSGPGVQSTRSLYNKFQLPREVPSDVRKYSRNFQLSTFSPSMNVGGSAEANVIFASHSFVPRVTSGNLTLHAFGRSYNFLEIGLYTEHLEHALEKLFGPSGKYKKSTLHDLYKEGKDRVKDFANSLRPRAKRDVSHLDENLVEPYHNEVNVKSRYSRHGTADMYVRVMGTAVMVNSVTSGHFKQNTLTESVIEGVEMLAEGAKHHKVDLTQPIPVFNDQVAIPTISGLPINIDVQGSTILSLQMSGNLDVDKLLFSDEDNKFHAKIAPSAATTLIGRMSTGRGFMEVGAELEGKIHSASGIEIKVEKEKEKFDLKVDMPVEKMQVLDVSSEIFWTEQAAVNKNLHKEPVNFGAEFRDYSEPNKCSQSDILGLKLCTQARFPIIRSDSPAFPLAGPGFASVVIEKTDKAMKGYHLRVLTELSDETKQSVSILLDTPGSKMNRKVSGKVRYTLEPFTKLELDVDSPWKKFSAFYEKQVAENVKSIDVAYLSEDDQYSGKAELKLTRVGSERIYEPLIQYVTPSGAHKLIEGKLEVTNGKKLKLDMRTDAGSYKSLGGSIKAEMEEKRFESGHKYEITTAELDYPSWNLGLLKLSGDITVASPTYGVNLVTQYGEAGQTLSLDSTYTHVKKQKMGLEAHMKSSAKPAFNFDLDWAATVDQKTDALEHKLAFAQGKDSDRLVIKQHSLYDTSSSKRFHILSELEIQRPARNVDLQLKLNAKKVVGKSQHYNFTMKSSDSHRAELSLRSGPDAFFDYNLKGVIQYPGQYYELTETARKASPDTWRYDTSLIQNPGNRYDALTKLVLRNERNNVQNALETTVTSPALSDPIIFKCGIVLKTASSSAFLALQSHGESQIDILTAYKQAGTKPQAVDVTALIKPYLSFNLSETHSRSSSKLNMKFKWMPTDRLITLDSLLKLHDQLTLDGTLKWDADKDESKTATLKSVTNFGVGWYIDTTNDVTIEGKTSNIRMKGKLAKDVLNGEHLLDFNFRNPSNQNLGIYINNVMESRSKFKSSQLKSKLQLFESSAYHLDWDNRLANIDTERLTVEAMTDMKVSYGHKKTLNLRGEFNSGSTNKRTLNGHFALSGSALSSDLGFDYNTEWKSDAFKINWNGNYGPKASKVELSGKLTKVNTKRVADLTYKITTPVQPKSVEGAVQYGYSFQNWRSFEVSESGSMAINSGIPSTWSNIIRSQDSEFALSSEIIREGAPWIDYGVSGRKDKKRIVVGLHGFVNGRGARFFSNLEGRFPYYNLRSNGSLKLENPGKASEFKLYHRSSQGGQAIETDFTVLKSSGGRLVLTNKLEDFPKRKSIDLLFTDGSTPRKVYLLVTENTPRWALDSYVKWGEGGKALSSKGGLEMSRNLMDIVVSLDSQALNINKWSARASRKINNGRQSVALDVEGKNEKVVSLGLDFAKKESASSESYDGTLRIETKKGQDFNGNFRVEKNLFDRKRNNEEGAEVKASLDLLGTAPMKLEMVTKSSDVEKKLAVSMCSENRARCRGGEFKLEQRSEDGEAEFVLRATAQSLSNGEKKVDGVVISTRKSEDRKNFEHHAQFIFGEEKESGNLGYRVYRSNGKEVGIEVQLPERLVSAIATAERRKGHDKAQISFWMDKLRKPDDKMSALFSLEDVRTEDSATGTEMILRVHHHALAQDLKLKHRLVTGGENTIVDFLTEMDVFRSEGELVLKTKLTREKVHHGHSYQLQFAAKAPNPALDVTMDSNLTKTHSEVGLQTDLTYQNREKNLMKSALNVQYSTEYASLTFGQAGAAPSVLFSTNWNSRLRTGSSGYDVRYEFLIPGMADARIFESQFNPTIPPHANVKMYTAQTPAGEFYEAFIGFKSNKQFAAGLYHQDNAERNVIGDFNLALNSSRLLLVKANWEPKTIEKTLRDAQERLNQTGQGLKAALSSTLNEASEEVQSFLSNLDNSLPELQPIADAYSASLEDIKTELKNSPETSNLVDYANKLENIVSNSTMKAMEVLSAAYEGVAIAAEKLVARLGSVPEAFKNLGEKIPRLVRSVTESTDKAVDALVEGTSKAMERAGEVFQNVGNFDGYNWDFLNETSSGIGKVLHQAVTYSVDAMTSTFEYLKNLGAELAENTWVKNFATTTISRYENLLADIIERMKSQLESLRESMLSSFPQQESQDFLLALFEYAEKKARGTPVNDTELREKIYDKFVTAVRKAGSELYTVDLQNGLVLAQLPLPKPIDSLSDFNQLFILDFPKWKLSLTPKRPYTYGIAEFYNFLKADSIGSLIHRTLFTSGSSIPPVSAVGLLVGSQYFRTFDGKFYNFEGNCRYLMASDFMDKNFTIAVDFENDGPETKKSILINYHGDSAVIGPDFSTEVRNLRRHSDEALSVKEDDKGHVTVKSQNGAIEVTCAKESDVCIIAIDGYYHGKTMGLLGTNNNEIHDDFSSPNGNVHQESQDFANSWKLDSECVERPISPRASANRESRHACAGAFTSKWSSLRSCYGAVPTSQFQKVCEQLSVQKGFNAKKAVCSTSVAYANLCASSFVNVAAPVECQ